MHCETKSTSVVDFGPPLTQVYPIESVYFPKENLEDRNLLTFRGLDSFPFFLSDKTVFQILLCFPESGGSLESLESLNSLESLQQGLF